MSFEGSSTDADGGVDEEQIVRETDSLLDEFADSSVAYLAQGLVDRAEAYDDGPAAALAIAAELRRRQAAGARFWLTEQHQPEGSGRTSAANHSS